MFACRHGVLVAALSLLLVFLPSGQCGLFKIPSFKGRTAKYNTAIAATSPTVESSPASASPAGLSDLTLNTPSSSDTSTSPQQKSIMSQVRDPSLLMPNKELLLVVPMPVASTAASAAFRSSNQLRQLIGRVFRGGHQAKAIDAARSSSTTVMSAGQKRAFSEVLSMIAATIAPPQFLKNAGPIKLGIWYTVLAAAGFKGGQLFLHLLENVVKSPPSPSPVPTALSSPQPDLLDAEPPLAPPQATTSTDVPTLILPTPAPLHATAHSAATPVVIGGWAPRIAVQKSDNDSPPSTNYISDSNADSASDSHQRLSEAPVVESGLSDNNTGSASDSYQCLPEATVVESGLSHFFTDVIIAVRPISITPHASLLITGTSLLRDFVFSMADGSNVSIRVLHGS